MMPSNVPVALVSDSDCAPSRTVPAPESALIDVPDVTADISSTEFSTTPDDAAMLPLPARASVPLLIVVAPVYVLVPEIVNVLPPTTLSEPAPEITPDIVKPVDAVETVARDAASLRMTSLFSVSPVLLAAMVAVAPASKSSVPRIEEPVSRFSELSVPPNSIAAARVPPGPVSAPMMRPAFVIESMPRVTTPTPPPMPIPPEIVPVLARELRVWARSTPVPPAPPAADPEAPAPAAPPAPPVIVPVLTMDALPPSESRPSPPAPPPPLNPPEPPVPPTPPVIVPLLVIVAATPAEVSPLPPPPPPPPLPFTPLVVFPPLPPAPPVIAAATATVMLLPR